MGAIVNGLNLQRPAGVRRRLLHLQRLHEGVAAAGRDHADPVDLRVHPRLDRRGRGRPDAPADRAARDAARDAQHQRRPSRGLQRDRARLAVRAQRDRDADRARALAPGRPDLGPVRGARRRDRSRRLRAQGLRRRAGPDPDRLRHRGPHRPRRREAPRPPRASRCGSSACRAWTASPSRTRPTATACCRRASRPASPSRPPPRSAGTAGSATHGDVVAMEGFGASAPAGALYKHFGFTGENVAARARAVLEGVRAAA